MATRDPFDPRHDEVRPSRARGSSPARADGDEPVTHALVGIARDLQTRVLVALREERGHVGLRPSLGPFLSLVWFEARPLAEIAQQLGISKQAVSQSAGMAERYGYIERAGSGGEGRRRAVRLSARGRALVEDAIEIVHATESEYTALVGEARLRGFASACETLYFALGVQPRADDRLGRASQPSIGVLPQLAHEIQRRLIQATTARGHEGLRPSQSQVLPLVARSGTRARDLAQRQRVSRQAISLACRELESLGHLRREPDPDDRRGAILRLTPRGERVLADALAASRDLEGEFAGILGRDRFEAFRATAAVIYAPIRARIAPGTWQEPASPRLGVIRGRGRADSEPRDLAALAARLRAELGSEGASALGALLAGGAPTRVRLQPGIRRTSPSKRSS